MPLLCMNVHERFEMKNPFKVGQTVYHPVYGKSEVGAIDKHQRSTHPVYLKGKAWVLVELLSYEPWPKPVHEKPFIPQLLHKQWVVVKQLCSSNTFLTRVDEELPEKVKTSCGLLSKDGHQFFRIAPTPIEFN